MEYLVLFNILMMIMIVIMITDKDIRADDCLTSSRVNVEHVKAA